MSDAASRLLAAVKASLAADPTLEALLGGPGRIHDMAPRNAPLPYLAVDPVASRPIGGVEAEVEEHDLTLTAWSRAGGKREALAITDRADARLAAAAPAPVGHALASMRLVRREARIARDRITATATLVYRAVTEPV
ncbi:DUF3168 domain-containing protein [Prosthecomicrobium sp. N25]|uniref:DUF3168 domain-containing protein n=1 Tax=Prosthecomicrobium sp. N25 TaxID=3129254 RepID=UPI003076A2EC